MSRDPLRNLTIVVVEDHDDARRYLDLFLNQMGANVVVARNRRRVYRQCRLGSKASRQQNITVRIWWCPTLKYAWNGRF